MASADIVLALRATVTSSAIGRELKRIKQGSNRMELQYENLFAEDEIEKVKDEVASMLLGDVSLKSERAAYAKLLEGVRYGFSQMLRGVSKEDILQT